ncbi:DUF4198 domain-containing protein [Reyranella sp.]|uniref:DUF4198 domain-containing protein n=1 Tax=Reyranella sp. TaxID=1929291 RepID=UPI0027234F13|nr:DUF4198 domain-containing protein [Reyranella sp.]MDO8974504.1 DUF4198 domain-containing protein [Reyranella sp.]
MKPIFGIAALAALSLSFAVPASAHHIWLEVDGQGGKIYFGEFGENLREASPGALDKLQPQAKVVSWGGERPLTVQKSANAYVATGKIDDGDSIVAEDIRWPSFERKRDNKTGIYMPAARFVPDRAPRAAVLTLDIVPRGDDKFQVVFKGKPLAKAKVAIVTPSGWGREERTGTDGEFEVKLPWRGPYVFEVHHDDNTAGKRSEQAYDFANYVTTLTVVQPQGIESLPAPAPAKPH